MIGVFAASQMAATAFVGVQRSMDPSEFGADLLDGRPLSRHIKSPYSNGKSSLGFELKMTAP